MKAGWLPDAGTNPFFFLTITVALLLVLSELLMQGFFELKTCLDYHERTLGDLLMNLGERSSLLNLDNVIKELHNRLRNVDPLETVVVRHLGLDMTQAWEKVEYVLSGLTNLRSIRYELLMLSDEGGPDRGTNSDVDRLLISGRRYKAILARRAWGLQTELKSKGVDLKFEVKTYCDTPVMHGIAVYSPFKQAYVNLCCWTSVIDAKYDWVGTSITG